MATVSELLSNAKNAFVGKETSVTKLKAIFALLAMGFEYDTLEDLSGRLGVRPIELKKLIRVDRGSAELYNAIMNGDICFAAGYMLLKFPPKDQPNYIYAARTMPIADFMRYAKDKLKEIRQQARLELKNGQT